MRHVRQMGFCSRKIRDWFQVQNLDYTKFLQEGIDVEIVEATGDAVAIMIAKLARDEAAEAEVANG